MKVQTKAHNSEPDLREKDNSNSSVDFIQTAKRHGTNHTSNHKRMPVRRKRQMR